MPLVQRNGLRFHVQELGESGSPVVMLHGLVVGSLSTWYFTVAPELARNHRVLLYDFRGHGRSERVESGYGMRSMAEDLAALADDFSPDEPVSLVGFSYGACVAVRYALDNPSRVDRLVLIEAPLPIVMNENLEWFLTQTPDELMQLVPESQRSAFARQGRRAERLVEQVHFLATVSSMRDDLLAEPDIPDRELARLDRPVLLCYGTHSGTADSYGQRLKEILPNAELALIDGDHYVHIEASGALTPAIDAFLDG
jgi:pimeloyl-ACP methyl ester carboxylesterase